MPAPLVLESPRLRLEPLARAHVDALCAAAAESRDTYALTLVPDGSAAMATYVDTAVAGTARGQFLAFAIVDKLRDRVVGSTRFCSFERWDWPGAPPASTPERLDAVEIGWTWLAASAQRTHVNTGAKRLMLTHAFEVWHVRRVTLKTDARNARSRANIERLGCRLDGVLRAHMPAEDGGVRDSAIYSLLSSEWPEAGARLASRQR
jgi:RimJ/RimL family protein N-acetyltransferase